MEAQVLSEGHSLHRACLGLDFSGLTSYPQNQAGVQPLGPGRVSYVFPQLLPCFPDTPGLARSDWPWVTAQFWEGMVPTAFPIHGVNQGLYIVVPTSTRTIMLLKVLRAFPGNMEFIKQKLTMRGMNKFYKCLLLSGSQEANPTNSFGRRTPWGCQGRKLLCASSLEDTGGCPPRRL